MFKGRNFPLRCAFASFVKIWLTLANRGLQGKHFPIGAAMAYRGNIKTKQAVECPKFLFQSELIDMVNPKDKRNITFEDVAKSRMGRIIVDILTDVKGFWEYDNRESLPPPEEE